MTFAIETKNPDRKSWLYYLGVNYAFSTDNGRISLFWSQKSRSGIGTKHEISQQSKIVETSWLNFSSFFTTSKSGEVDMRKVLQLSFLQTYKSMNIVRLSWLLSYFKNVVWKTNLTAIFYTLREKLARRQSDLLCKRNVTSLHILAPVHVCSQHGRSSNSDGA